MLIRLIREDIELVKVLDRTDPTVKVDPGQMEQVIMNLVINGRDAMPQGGRLTIETQTITLDQACCQDHPDVTPGLYVVLSVSDDGVGMDADTRVRIFEPFYTTKAADKGTGLGLSTVYGIVKQSQGFIEVYSEPGHGATFKIYLPRIEAAPVRPKAAMPPALSQGSETILVVEDDDMLRPLTVYILERHGYKAMEARNGGEALLLCEQHQGPIHLMLTDVVMPRMSGRELADKLRPLRPEMKVLYMSGYPYDPITHHGVLDESIVFIQKPFKPGALTRKVRELLDDFCKGQQH